MTRAEANPLAVNWSLIYERLRERIVSSGVAVRSEKLGLQTTGIFDGLSITTNSDCDLETRCHNMGHAFGHIVQWSLDRPRCAALYEALYRAKDNKADDPAALEAALDAFRAYEEEASEYAAWLMRDVAGEAADACLASFAPFARADIEAIVSYHREGVAPIWLEFFADWKATAARGEIEPREFVPRPIPAFTPRAIEPQEVIQGVRA